MRIFRIRLHQISRTSSNSPNSGKSKRATTKSTFRETREISAVYRVSECVKISQVQRKKVLRCGGHSEGFHPTSTDPAMIGNMVYLSYLRYDCTALAKAHRYSFRRTKCRTFDLQGFHRCEIRKYSIGQGGEGVATQVEEYNVCSSGSVQA